MADRDDTRVSAKELRQYLTRQTRRMRMVYRSLIVLICAVVVGLCAHVIFYYNYLTDLKFDVLTARSKVAGTLQYRKNLLPVFVETLVSFVEHEDSVFNRTVDARERGLKAGGRRLADQLREAIGGPTKPGKGAGGASGGVLGDLTRRIMAIAEQYPLLKTSEVYQLMIKQVADVESKILAERMKYNDSVNIYTTALSMFPGNLYGYLFKFQMYDYFEDIRGSELPRIELVRYQRSGRKGS